MGIDNALIICYTCFAKFKGYNIMAFEELLQYVKIKVAQTNTAREEDNKKQSSSRELLDF